MRKFRPREGENWLDVYDRALEFLHSLITKYIKDCLSCLYILSDIFEIHDELFIQRFKSSVLVFFKYLHKSGSSKHA